MREGVLNNCLHGPKCEAMQMDDPDGLPQKVKELQTMAVQILVQPSAARCTVDESELSVPMSHSKYHGIKLMTFTVMLHIPNLNKIYNNTCIYADCQFAVIRKLFHVAKLGSGGPIIDMWQWKIKEFSTNQVTVKLLDIQDSVQPQGLAALAMGLYSMICDLKINNSYFNYAICTL